ncbi:hypothetical protein U1Q18_031254, partial [Sarracenia purpurea var. burkii]
MAWFEGYREVAEGGVATDDGEAENGEEHENLKELATREDVLEGGDLEPPDGGEAKLRRYLLRTRTLMLERYHVRRDDQSCQEVWRENRSNGVDVAVVSYFIGGRRRNGGGGCREVDLGDGGLKMREQ